MPHRRRRTFPATPLFLHFFLQFLARTRLPIPTKERAVHRRDPFRQLARFARLARWIERTPYTTDRPRKRNEIKLGLKVKKERLDGGIGRSGRKSAFARRVIDGLTEIGGKRTRKDVKFRRSLADSPFGRRASPQSVKRMDALFRGRRRRPISRSNEFSGQWKDGNTDGKARCRPSSGLVIPRYEVKRGWLGDRAALGA